MTKQILPKGLNHKDIWGTFKEANLPAPCEHCGNHASSKSLTLSRKVWGMDLCVDCLHLRSLGQLDSKPASQLPGQRNPFKQSKVDDDGDEDNSLPF